MKRTRQLQLSASSKSDATLSLALGATFKRRQRCHMECFLYSFVALGSFLKGGTAVIQTHPNVAAAAGEDARLVCRLLETKEVHQVTWQKIFEGKAINIGSYERFNGETVNPDFLGKVQFKEAGLQNNSIVIRNVTEQDGGCYVCVFSTFPDGGLSNNTCLHVYELHEPVLQVRRSKSPEESVVSCSATGRPAPTVTLTVPQHLHLSLHNTVTVTNTNNTVTVTTTAVLSGLHDDSTQVGCEARVDSGPQVEVVKRITELRQTTSDDDLEQSSESDQKNYRWGVVISCVFVATCVASLFICYMHRKHTQNSETEMNEAPTLSINDTPRPKDGLTPESSVRKRPTPENEQTNALARTSKST